MSECEYCGEDFRNDTRDNHGIGKCVEEHTRKAQQERSFTVSEVENMLEDVLKKCEESKFDYKLATLVDLFIIRSIIRETKSSLRP